jgi:hypothetical protein
MRQRGNRTTSMCAQNCLQVREVLRIGGAWSLRQKRIDLVLSASRVIRW